MRKWIAFNLSVIFSVILLQGVSSAMIDPRPADDLQSYTLVRIAAGEQPAKSEEEQVGEPQSVCPVMGGKVNRDIYVDYRGKRIYFCCEHCKGEFNKDPEGYIKEMEDEGVVLEKTPRG